ncbi:hypothetical protein [Staphylococcus gallinarum]|uniref:hypothetical protein n=1 Tax=Staphylococcus gallinarum TaxID=1293 RepID=UPI001E5CE4E1|nr:hypothetical protein [Staphylococcus gallinarum]MCD8845220.1 hypothetical protein [Staphylococcus gallinarum]
MNTNMDLLERNLKSEKLKFIYDEANIIVVTHKNTEVIIEDDNSAYIIKDNQGHEDVAHDETEVMRILYEILEL